MSGRLDVGAMRREQIAEAAAEIIADQGIQKLSLSAIEDRTGMSRGQLTYYFKTKEDILLAVFDRLLAMMHERTQTRDGENRCDREQNHGWERLRHFLAFFLLRPPDARLFHSLQYTFLSQLGHREDFRARVAGLYEEWRTHMAGDMAEDLAQRPDGGVLSARTFASFVQALLHGLAMQRAADPNAFDRQEMLALCLDVLGRFLGRDTLPPPAVNPAASHSGPESNDCARVNHE